MYGSGLDSGRDGPPRLPGHALLAVAAARGERARARRRRRAAAARARGDGAGTVRPRGRPPGRPARARPRRGDGDDRGRTRRARSRAAAAWALPVGVQANLALALRQGGYDVVHGFEPGLPSLSYFALRDTKTLAVATFFSPERLTYPPRKTRRRVLLGRIDALLATSPRPPPPRRNGSRATIASSRPGSTWSASARVRSAASRSSSCRPASWRWPAPHSARCPTSTAGSSSSCARSGSPAGRRSPQALRDRVHVRTARDADTRAGLLAEAAVFLPAPGGVARSRSRLRPRVAPSRLRRASPISLSSARPRSPGSPRTTSCARGLGAEAREQAEAHSFARVAAELDDLYRGLATRRRRPPRGGADPLAGRDWIVADLHMHTSWSHDCSIEVPELLDHAESEGLGAIAVTDHNVFGGALEAVELARDRDLVVIPGEEVKTDGQGEVIGLFLEQEIPRGLSFGDTIAAIREQGGLVYLPHPFDRMHAIPDPATLHRHLPEIDVLEVYNARLLFEAYNDEALRFAAQVRPRSRARARTPTCCRASARAPCGCAASRAGGVPARAARRRGAAPAEVARLPPEPQVGRAGQGKGPLGENGTTPRARRAHRRDLRALPRRRRSPRSTSCGRARRLRRLAARARARLGPPARGHVPAQADAAALGDPGGDRVLRPVGPGAAEVAERLRVDPLAVYGTNCFKFGTEDPSRRSAG